MNQKTKEIAFTICGQGFRLRATGEDAKKIRRVASRVDKCIRGYKGKRASSDVRAAVMAAYELAFELEEFRDDKTAGTQAIDNTHDAIDRLIARLDEQMDVGEESSAEKKVKKKTSQKKSEKKNKPDDDSSKEDEDESQSDMFAEHS